MAKNALREATIVHYKVTKTPVQKQRTTMTVNHSFWNVDIIITCEVFIFKTFGNMILKNCTSQWQG